MVRFYTAFKPGLRQIFAVRGKVISNTNVALGPHPGREFVIESQEDAETVGMTYTLRARVRLYVIGRRCYQVARTVTPESDGPTDAARFFDSFELRALE